MQLRPRSDEERRRRRAVASCLGVGYILGWVMGYDSRRQERRW